MGIFRHALGTNYQRDDYRAYGAHALAGGVTWIHLLDHSRGCDVGTDVVDCLVFVGIGVGVGLGIRTLSSGLRRHKPSRATTDEQYSPPCQNCASLPTPYSRPVLMPCTDERLVNRRGPNRGGYIVLRLLITLAGLCL